MTRFARRRRMARGDETQYLALTIERLTLEGVSRVEGQRIADSLTSALSRALEGQDLPNSSRQIDRETVKAPVQGRLLPEDTGVALAEIVARQVLS